MREQMHYIDKTECLEKGIVVFPSIYIMGASATGKSVMVEMFLKKHPQTETVTVDMEKISEDKLIETIDISRRMMEERETYFVLDHVPVAGKSLQPLVTFIEELPKNCRVIMIGRNCLPEELIPLLWKSKLEIIPQERLAFSSEEVRELARIWKSPLNPYRVWRQTGGWAGCVDLMLRISANNKLEDTPEDLRNSYEISTYIEKYILGELEEKEKEIFQFACKCPWLNEELCRYMCGDDDWKSLLTDLTRKGFLIYSRKMARWKVAPLFLGCKDKVQEQEETFRQLGKWFEYKGYLREAYRCYTKMASLENNFFWQEKSGDENLKASYLRGMQCYMKGDFRGLDVEIQKVACMDTENPFLKKEILLNLYFAKPDFTLDDWITMVEEATKEFAGAARRFRLYDALGNSCTYLCGVRDLTGLFACSKKDENRCARILRNAFEESEWVKYYLAKIDYYLETERQDMIRNEEWALLKKTNVNPLAKLYLTGKMYRVYKDEEYAEQFAQESNELLLADDLNEVKLAEAYICSHSSLVNETEKLTRWLKDVEEESKADVNEENYQILWFIAKGYFQLGQYRKAEKILKRLIPYIKKYNRHKLLAEAYFQQAIISWEMGNHAQALQNVIESFYISKSTRYVRFYISYGKRAKGVFEAYEEWYQKNEPEGWIRKKKYQYGNVLRMPFADYLDVIIRGVRREAGSEKILHTQSEVTKEQLTMMETIILQDIGRGLTNQEICIEQNLKLPTVKTHIYSLYKKLGVNSRVQATLKGKEMGILE